MTTGRCVSCPESANGQTERDIWEKKKKKKALCLTSFIPHDALHLYISPLFPCHSLASAHTISNDWFALCTAHQATAPPLSSPLRSLLLHLSILCCVYLQHLLVIFFPLHLSPASFNMLPSVHVDNEFRCP